jgi:peptide/nickel transport system permease protein
MSHLFGTDDRGRDVLSRMIHGTRISLSIGFVAVGIAAVIGIAMGGIAGFYGGKIDFIISRLFEVMMTFPVFFLILTILAFRNPSIYNIMIVIGATGWTGIARLVRGDFLKLRQFDYVEAAIALGGSDFRVMLKHMLPNALAPVLVAATFGIAGAILVESALSFLGFGVPPPTPSWGDVLSQSKKYVDFAWWLVLFPGAAIFITVTSFNLVGEGFRNAIDPKIR